MKPTLCCFFSLLVEEVIWALGLYSNHIFVSFLQGKLCLFLEIPQTEFFLKKIYSFKIPLVNIYKYLTHL